MEEENGVEVGLVPEKAKFLNDRRRRKLTDGD